MVAVLPWHDPVRVAEQVAVLICSAGVGPSRHRRGLGRVEFEGFRCRWAKSRERFVRRRRSFSGL